MDMIIRFSRAALGLIVSFTAIETLVLTLWLYLLGIPINTGLLAGLGVFVALFVGATLVEHLSRAFPRRSNPLRRATPFRPMARKLTVDAAYDKCLAIFDAFDEEAQDGLFKRLEDALYPEEDDDTDPATDD